MHQNDFLLLFFVVLFQLLTFINSYGLNLKAKNHYCRSVLWIQVGEDLNGISCYRVIALLS